MRFQETPTYRGMMPYLRADYKNDFVEELSTLCTIAYAPRSLARHNRNTIVFARFVPCTTHSRNGAAALLADQQFATYTVAFCYSGNEA